MFNNKSMLFFSIFLFFSSYVFIPSLVVIKQKKFTVSIFIDNKEELVKEQKLSSEFNKNNLDKELVFIFNEFKNKVKSFYLYSYSTKFITIFSPPPELV
jgi:hypothetical protein